MEGERFAQTVLVLVLTVCRKPDEIYGTNLKSGVLAGAPAKVRDVFGALGERAGIAAPNGEIERVARKAGSGSMVTACRKWCGPPAQFRYRGRFYTEVDPDEIGVLGEKFHQWLIVSALYGLVGPKESIQRYSCHTEDNREITEIWRSGIMTSLLLHLVRGFDVAVVVDLLADESYRELVDWNKLEDHRVKVLRAYGDQNAGPGLLPALGDFARDTLSFLQPDELLSIDTYRTFHTDYEDVALSLEGPPWPEPPRR